jgi:hypothetical protein
MDYGLLTKALYLMLIFISRIKMKKPAAIRSALIIAFIISSFSVAFATKTNSTDRTIELAGLVVNAKDLSPVEAAKIYDADNNLLGSTDKNGYYHIHFGYSKTGELYFKLKIVKDGFQSFTQSEHWGNLNDPKNVMYFGLRANHAAAGSFASFADNRSSVSDLSYSNVLNHFSKVRGEKEFNDQLADAKAGNEKVLVLISGKFYIVDNNGWIQINSDKDAILINDKQVLVADQLNANIKRKDVKWMSPVDSKQAKFAIHTR